MIPFLGAGIGLAREVAGPMIQQNLSDFREAAGYNDIAQARAVMYAQMRGSTLQSLSDNFTPFRLSFGQCLTAFNQGPWPRGDADGDLRRRLWRHLRDNLRYCGVDMALPEEAQLLSTNETAPSDAAQEWMRLIGMSSAQPPIHSVIRDYYRSIPLEGDRKAVSVEELHYNLQRGEFRRKQDRERLLKPFYTWQVQQIQQLTWRGLLNVAERQSMLESVGITRPEDLTLADWLMQIIPEPAILTAWATRSLFNDDLCKEFGLDERYEDSPMAKFFSKAQGVGFDAGPLPNEPDGNKNWLQMQYRASAKLPTLQEAIALQRRLRPDAIRSENSPLVNLGEWKEEDTKKIMTLEGMPATIQNQMVALATEPPNLLLIERILAPVLEHDSIKALVEETYGRGTDWVKESLLDHGYDADFAKLSSKAIQQLAYDTAYKEKLAHDAQIRAGRHKVVTERYSMGTLTKDEAAERMTDKFMDEAQARLFLGQVDDAIAAGILTAKIGALKEAYMTGQLTEDQTKTKLSDLRITPGRKDQYIEEWKWQRTTNQKHLVTAEIMQAMKAGVMQPQQAIMRLTNLGWTQADAMIEVQVVQHEMQIAQQKLQAAQQQHAQAQADAAKRAQQAKAAHAAQAAKEAAKVKEKTDHEKTLATHQKLMHQSAYYAKVHNSNSEYAKADKAGDEEKKSAELQKQQADYQRWLVEQLELINEGKEVANVVGPLQTTQAPGPDTSAGATGPSHQPDTSTGGPGGKSSGNN